MEFNEIVCICDDQSWVWNFLTTHLRDLGRKHVRVASSIIVRKSWHRIKNAPFIILYWENNERSSGAIIEEILQVDPLFNVSDRIIVLTNNPQHEDVVYFSELSVTRIVRMQLRAKSLKTAGEDFNRHIEGANQKTPYDKKWFRILRTLSFCTEATSQGHLKRLESTLKKLAEASKTDNTARYYDAMALISSFKNEPVEAVRLWNKALEVNPNYYQTYNNLIQFYQRTKQHGAALELTKKMHTLNKKSVSRSVLMGQIHSDMAQDDKAEHYFGIALAKDRHCSPALNGLAEIRFRQDRLEDARGLLARSNIAYRTAAYLNLVGIELVKERKYKAALVHYSKAQFVLPQQSKGPMLFYNIGLCYSKWGKPKMAAEFLKIALIKEPNYQKALNLLSSLDNPKVASLAS